MQLTGPSIYGRRQMPQTTIVREAQHPATQQSPPIQQRMDRPVNRMVETALRQNVFNS